MNFCISRRRKSSPVRFCGLAQRVSWLPFGAAAHARRADSSLGAGSVRSGSAEWGHFPLGRLCWESGWLLSRCWHSRAFGSKSPSSKSTSNPSCPYIGGSSSSSRSQKALLPSLQEPVHGTPRRSSRQGMDELAADLADGDLDLTCAELFSKFDADGEP